MAGMIHLYRLLIRTYPWALIYLLGTLDGCDPVMQPMNFAGNANQPCGSFKRMAYRTDGRAIHQQPAVRRTTTRTVTTHRVPRSHQREAAYEERPPQQESGLSAIRTA
jgi:hypothetical protein